MEESALMYVHVDHDVSTAAHWFIQCIYNHHDDDSLVFQPFFQYW